MILSYSNTLVGADGAQDVVEIVEAITKYVFDSKRSAEMVSAVPLILTPLAQLKVRQTPSVKYWHDTLDGELPVLEVHTDFPRPAVMTTNGASVPVLVDSSTAQALEALCRTCGFTMMRGVLAAWAVLLGKHSGQEEVVVGIPYANREHPATHEVVGYFVNTLAIRVGLDGTVSFRDMVVETGKSVSKAVEHADLPFMKVVEAVAPERDASRTPVYQTMFSWEEAAGWDSASEGFVGLEVIEL